MDGLSDIGFSVDQKDRHPFFREESRALKPGESCPDDRDVVNPDARPSTVAPPVHTPENGRRPRHRQVLCIAK
jgi:hypothetical protein